MNPFEPQEAKRLRISAQEVKARLDQGEPVTILDARGPRYWKDGAVQIKGAIRIHPGQWQIDPEWPPEQLTVIY